MNDYTISNVRFTSSDGKSRVHGWVYAPNSEPVAMLQISHGMCEYIGRYHWFMEALCKQGFVVFGNDHIGHGESSEPEQYGYFGEKKRLPSFDLRPASNEHYCQRKISAAAIVPVRTQHGLFCCASVCQSLCR